MPIDIIQTGEDGTATSQGSVAQTLLANNMNPNALRTNATLRKEEWIELDQAVVTVAQERLIGVDDLFDNNLTYTLNNAMGTLVLQHETQSDMTAAEVTMDGVTRSENDRVTFELVNTPIPITHKDFLINVRALEASRRLGQSLDVTQVQAATRQVVTTLENTLFNGLAAGGTLGFGPNTASLYGYTNRPGRNTFTISTAWTDAAATGETILDDILDALEILHGDNMFGPYVLYLTGPYYIALLDDFKANSDKSIISRLLEIPELLQIRAADRLAANNAVLVQMTRENVDIIDGIQPTVVSWETNGGMTLNFKVLAIMVPRIKLDQEGNSGIVHMST